MMYDSKMALAVKTHGRVLRESKNGDNTTVFLPFGCEYSILVKNLNSVRALVKVWIDGTDVTEDTQLVIRPNSSIDLERFINGGNWDAGNRFKFIERTSAVSAHRGNKIDDGLIRVEFEFERARPVYQPSLYRGIQGTIYNSSTDNFYLGSNSPFGDVVGSAAAASDSSTFVGSVTASAASSISPRSLSNVPTKSARKPAETDIGVTVAGSISTQRFVEASWFPTDGVKHVMVMQMLGELEGQPVAQPRMVHHKPTCTTCGKVNKATSKFCAECGTSLQLVETMA